MVKFRVHFEVCEYKDFIDLEWETVEEVRNMAKEEIEKRGATGLYSERI